MKANLLHTWVGFENETKPNCREFSGERLNAASFCDWERVNSSIILSHNVIKYFLKGFLFSSSLTPSQASGACGIQICVLRQTFPPLTSSEVIEHLNYADFLVLADGFWGNLWGNFLALDFCDFLGWLFNTLDTFQRYFNSTSFRIEVAYENTCQMFDKEYNSCNYILKRKVLLLQKRFLPILICITAVAIL